ncbi:MAG: MmgE/PrpD family protein [Betaproteobacteria bacterium]|nr:MmgE/PrpD family protein [Betaproteobacteria bacterium]
MTQAATSEAHGEHQTTQADNRYTKKIAQFVSGLTYEKIPAEVRHRIKLLILDSIGCGIYGSTKHHSQLAIEAITAVDESRSCGLWGTDKRVSAPHAALLNGTMVQGFELDDIHRKGAMHIGPTTLPAIVALSEARGGMTGKRFITAAVAGYEVGPRVGMCMGPDHLGQGWHSGATVGAFAGAASSAAALGLSEESTIDALGIAGTFTGGIMAVQYGAMVKRMNHGRSAQNGLYAGMLASVGYTGIKNVFESEYGGFCTTFSRKREWIKWEELTRGLGEHWETMYDSLKFYSAAASNHSTLDAIRLMRERRPFTADEVEKIVVHGSQVTKDHVFWKYEPSGSTNMQFCMPYVVATLLLEGDFFVDQCDESKMADPQRIAHSRKVEFIAEPEITRMGNRYYVRVEVFLKDGTRMEETVEAQRGSESRFASDAEIIEKFEKLVKHVLPQKQVAEIRDTILGMEQMDDAAKLAKLLVKAGR